MLQFPSASAAASTIHHFSQQNLIVNFSLINKIKKLKGILPSIKFLQSEKSMRDKQVSNKIVRIITTPEVTPRSSTTYFMHKQNYLSNARIPYSGD